MSSLRPPEIYDKLLELELEGCDGVCAVVTSDKKKQLILKGLFIRLVFFSKHCWFISIWRKVVKR